MGHVPSSAVAAYEPLVQSLARRLAGRARWARVERDDLAQEGRIAVWQALARGVPVKPDIVRGRMVSWIRHQSTGIPYEQLLPLDDFRHAPAR